jgi:hypothetical protein
MGVMTRGLMLKWQRIQGPVVHSTEIHSEKHDLDENMISMRRY